jgi:hypothetical protein
MQQEDNNTYWRTASEDGLENACQSVPTALETDIIGDSLWSTFDVEMAPNPDSIGDSLWSTFDVEMASNLPQKQRWQKPK